MAAPTPRKVQIFCTAEEDCTKQSFKDECDMNNIVARINKTGFVPLEAQDSLRRLIYDDASTAPQSLEAAYEIVQRAEDAFAALPARVRERFPHPAALLAFVENPDNMKEAQDLGILAKTAPMPTSGPKSGPVESPVNREAASQQSAPAVSVQEPGK